MDRKQQLKFEILSYLLAAGFVYLFYKSLLVSAIGGFMGVLFKDEYERYLKQKKDKLMMVQFKDLLYSISSSMATGRYMYEALKDGEEYLKMIYSEESPMVKELSWMNNAIYDNHASEEEILIDFAVRSGIDDIKDFVDVYITTRSTGGDIQKVISNTSLVIMEKMQIQKEIEIIMAQKQLETKIVTMIPIFIMLFLNIFSPDYLVPMYTTPVGRIIMTCALVGFIVAFKWIAKITEV